MSGTDVGALLVPRQQWDLQQTGLSPEDRGCQLTWAETGLPGLESLGAAIK